MFAKLYYPFLGIKIKEAVNQPRYGRLYNFIYSQIFVCHNNWILMNFFDDGRDEENNKHIIQTTIGGNMMNMSLIIMEVKYVAINTGDYPCRGYYIINFSSSPYTLQADFSIDGQFIYSDEMVFEGNYFFPVNINFHS